MIAGVAYAVGWPTVLAGNGDSEHTRRLTVSKMSINTVRTCESPATHRPERYRASLPRASALSKYIGQHSTPDIHLQPLDGVN